MKHLVASFLILTATLSQGNAYTEAQLYQEFDARLLTDDEKRFLQAALALSGDYTGLIDGAWGRGSQTALERYATRELDNYDGTVPSFVAVFAALVLVFDIGIARTVRAVFG